MKKRIFTLNPVKRLMKDVGARRVSQDAVEELALVLEKKTLKICERAKKLAKLAGRKTVMKSDIKLAVKEILEER